MTKFVYIGQHVQVYPDILVPDGDNAPKVLVAHPGDVCEFGIPPTDGLWAEARPAKPVKVKD